MHTVFEILLRLFLKFISNDIVYLDLNGRALQYRFDIPALPGIFVGTGDVFISLLLIWMDKLNGDITTAIQNTISTLQSILRRTANRAYRKILSSYFLTDIFLVKKFLI